MKFLIKQQKDLEEYKSNISESLELYKGDVAKELEFYRSKLNNRVLVTKLQYERI
ncbi:MAG: hypothetical protein MJH09_09890 [Cetobacterium sp.]|nr:hypothetical protein [Cetobacterium sp.]